MGLVATEDAQRGRFPPALMHSAARLYYDEDATQAEVGARLGLSRATVSRLLSEARRAGIVRIEVIAPAQPDVDDLAGRVERALGLDAVHLSTLPGHGSTGEALAPALSAALRSIGLVPGDVLLVSSGRTVYEAAQAQLPALPGVTLAPMIGGQDEPEVWYAPNEITRQFAAKVGGTPVFLYAPALPGAELFDTLLHDPSTRRVLELWTGARAAIMGVGAPPLTRTSLPRFIANDTGSLREAVGDVCSRFYDADGRPVPFPGSDRLLATGFEALRELPVGIAVAAGAVKVPSIRTGAASGYFNQLVTDAETAWALLAAADAAA
jgi:DNA-binding transcriptional regulator LsrR (DeoR family)